MIYAEVPTRVEYSLTPLGGTMCSVVHDGAAMGGKGRPEIAMARKLFDATRPR